MSYAQLATKNLPSMESVETAEAQALVALVYAVLAVDERLRDIHQAIARNR